MKPITVTTTGKQFATSTTAAATVLPFDSSGYYPKAIWVSATVPTYVKLTGPLSATAVAGDLMIQPADPILLKCQGYTGISALTISGTGVLNVAPAEIGSWGDGTSLSLAFTSMTSLDSRITFARADATTCATYFDSTGRLQTAAANVARFDYDPSTAAGVTGGELMVNGSFSSGLTSWTPQGAVSASVAGGYAVVTNVSNFADRIEQYVSTTVGKTYQITFTAYSSSGNYRIAAIEGASPFGTLGSGIYSNTTPASNTFTFKATTTSTTIQIVPYAGSASQVVYATGFTLKEATFTPRGLLIEESRQNLLLQSRDQTNAAWTKTDVTPTRNQVGIDGVANTACLMTEGSAGTAITAQSATVAAGSTVTVSVVAKRGNTDWFRLQVVDGAVVDGGQAWFNLNTGTKGTTSAIGAGTSVSSTMTSLGGGWYRCTVTATPNGTYTSAVMRWRSAAADASGTLVSGATYIVDYLQLEVGSFATSPIATTAATVTRAADSASMTGSNFSSWFNATQGTFVAEYSGVPASGVARGVISANDGTVNNKVDVRGYPVGFASYVVSGNVVQSSIGSAATSGKVATTYAVNDFAVSVNGAGVITDTSGSLPVGVNQLQIGGLDNLSSYQTNGWIRRLQYFPTRLTNAQLQSLTT